MNKVEEFFEEVRKAIVSIPKKPNLIMKEADVVGIKLSSDMLDKLTKDSYFATEKDYKAATLMGVKVYLDETVNRPKYIVEGEIMASFHPEALKGNSIKSYAIDEAVKPSEASKIKIPKSNSKELYEYSRKGTDSDDKTKIDFIVAPDIADEELKSIKEADTSEALEYLEDRITQKDVHWLNDTKFNYCIKSEVFEEDIDENQDEKDYIIALQTKELHFVVEKLGIYEDMGSPTTIKQALLKAQEQEKELAELKKALECWEIVKNKPFILQKLFENKGLENQQEYDKKYFWGTITEEEVAKVKEGLK